MYVTVDFLLVVGVIVLSSAYPIQFVFAERGRQLAAGRLARWGLVVVAVREDSELVLSSIV
jgi:hypothetical protein